MTNNLAAYKQFCTKCVDCGSTTSKSYARAHSGQCKSCADPGAPSTHRGPKCPQCGSGISRYKAAHGYVCEGCYRENDPAGYAAEVRGY